MLPFRFQHLDGIPVSDQLVKAVQRAVLTGELAVGERFPSVRVLAQELRISPTTAHKAVMELRDGGYLATRPGAGMVVVRPAGATRERLMEQLEPACRDLLRQASLLGLTAEETLQALRRALSNGTNFTT
jgi:GntR family transcriptional regulator